MDFEVHDEGQFTTEQEFLSGFLSAVCGILLQLLGRRPKEPVHVILSTHEKHAARFPPTLQELAELEDLSEIPEAEQEEYLRRFATSLYAHGVTTLAAAVHDLPAGVQPGQLAVFLDVNTILALADQVEVLREGMLGRVAAHEMSHAFRGHATDGGTTTHGWFKEGDAQRDAWHVLAELLANPEWTSVARWGRAAQVRLSSEQPSAYRCFETDWTERSRLAHDPALDRVTSWLLRPPRDVFVLSRLSTVEVPLSVAARRILGAPNAGDQVYLADSEMVAGPWVVVTMRRNSRGCHPKDLAAVERLSKDSRSKPEVEWMVLRPLGSMSAAREADASGERGLVVKRLTSGEAQQLASQLGASAEEVSQRVADEVTESYRESIEQIDEMRRQAGQPVEDGPWRERDPYDDW